MGRGVDWVDLFRNMDRLRAIVNVAMNFLILYIVGNFLAS